MTKRFFIGDATRRKSTDLSSSNYENQTKEEVG